MALDEDELVSLDNIFGQGDIYRLMKTNKSASWGKHEGRYLRNEINQN